MLKKIGILLVVCTLSGCATLQMNADHPLFESAVKAAVAKIIENQSNKVEAAQKILAIARQVQASIDPEKTVDPEALRIFIDDKVDWDSLETSDKILILGLINTVVHEIREVIREKISDEEKMVLVSQILGYVVEAAEGFADGT